MWIHEINRSIFGRRYYKRNEGIVGVLAREMQKRGVIHFHALFATGGARRLSWMDRWYEIAGIARIYPYNRDGGADKYVSKYVTKEHGGGEIEVIGPCEVMTLWGKWSDSGTS